MESGPEIMTMQASFRVDLNRVRSRLRESVSQKAVRVAQGLLDSFISRSPVYSGNFRASWNVSEGKATYVRISSGSVYATLPPPKIKIVATNSFPVFYITNGQPYAQALEYGWSNQAPLGIIRVTLASLR